MEQAVALCPQRYESMVGGTTDFDDKSPPVVVGGVNWILR